MGRLFFSLYLFIALTLVTLSALLDKIVFDEPQRPAVDAVNVLKLVESVNTLDVPLESILDQAGFPYQVRHIDDIGWHPEDETTLRSGKGVTLHDHDAGLQIFVLGQNDTLYEISIPYQNTAAFPFFLYSSVFFLLLGVVLLIWVWPLWRDLSQLKKATEHIQPDGSLNEIEVGKHSLVSPIAQALNTMSRKIALLMKSHKELTGAVAHEFRTPLARLKFALAMSTTESDDNAKAMQEDVAELEKLVEEMLSFTSLDAQLPEMDISEIPLHRLCQTVVSRVRHVIDSSIDITISGEDATLMADTHYIERALENLLLNAGRYAQCRIDIQLATQANSVSIAVEDDGAGVAPDMRERIFEPFFRPDDSRNRQRGGAGLGLAIVKRIMEWHGGRCWVESGKRGGARFILAFKTHH